MVLPILILNRMFGDGGPPPAPVRRRAAPLASRRIVPRSASPAARAPAPERSRARGPRVESE